jgi:hypothetical protein
VNPTTTETEENAAIRRRPSLEGIASVPHPSLSQPDTQNVRGRRSQPRRTMSGGAVVICCRRSPTSGCINPAGNHRPATSDESSTDQLFPRKTRGAHREDCPGGHARGSHASSSVILRPEGAGQHSPGQRPGSLVQLRPSSPDGAAEMDRRVFASPLQGFAISLCAPTQGVALGYYALPLQGRRNEPLGGQVTCVMTLLVVAHPQSDWPGHPRLCDRQRRGRRAPHVLTGRPRCD